MIKKANTDLIAGIVGLAVTAAFWLTLDPEMTRLSIMFPRAMTIIMGCISVVLVIKGFWKAERQDLFAEGSNFRVAVTALHFFVWGLAIPYLGFFVTSVCVMSSLIFYLARARRRYSPKVMAGWVLVVIFVVGFFYSIFTKLLHVPLPSGYLM